MMVKQLHTNFYRQLQIMSSKSSDLVDNLSEIYKKEFKGCKKRKKANEYAILLDLKIINYITNAKNVKKDG